jgi:hypothetical protein
LLVEGEPGTGKSLLLARAGEEAGHRSFLLVAAVAGELSPAPLLAAVNAVQATPGNGAGRRETTAPAPWADVVLAGLEELASAGPVLVTADDVQWADPATMQAFRSMPRLLASYPSSSSGRRRCAAGRRSGFRGGQAVGSCGRGRRAWPRQRTLPGCVM